MQEATAQEKEELEKIKEKCLNCKKCLLGKTRTNIVFSAGIPNHKLMLIGEAPGYYEDQKGEPFVGKAGQLLDKIFASVGLSKRCLHLQHNKMQTARKPRSSTGRKRCLQRIS